MAIVYLRSTDGSDLDDGSTWALAKATLAAALTAAGAGGTVYVSQAHAETQASSMTLTSPGTAGSPTLVLCVSDAAEPPTALASARTATVTSTGTVSISYAGFAYVWGIIFTTGTGTGTCNQNFTSQAPWAWKMEGCSIRIGSSGASSDINLGANNSAADDQSLELVNTTMQFGGTGQGIDLGTCRLTWLDTVSAISGATLPTTFIGASAAFPGKALISGVDLSALGSGNLVDQSVAAPHTIDFRNCKLGSGAVAVTGTHPGVGGCEVRLDNCNSGDVNGHFEHYTFQGSVTRETSKVRSGGASADGTAYSAKMVSAASGVSFEFPLHSISFGKYNTGVGSAITATVEIAQDSAAAALTESEVWLEVEYMGTTGFPLSVLATDHNSTALTKSATAQTTSSVTWNNMTTPTKQKLAVTFTTQEVGHIKCIVHLAKASVTLYVDPVITVS